MIRNLGKGSHFGEIALLNDMSRTMTVKATTDVRVLCIDKASFVKVAGPLRKNLKFDYERERTLYNQARTTTPKRQKQFKE